MRMSMSRILLRNACYWENSVENRQLSRLIHGVSDGDDLLYSTKTSPWNALMIPISAELFLHMEASMICASVWQSGLWDQVKRLNFQCSKITSTACFSHTRGSEKCYSTVNILTVIGRCFLSAEKPILPFLSIVVSFRWLMRRWALLLAGKLYQQR